MEANARRKRAGLEPWPVPGIAKRGSAIQMAKYMVSENEITQPDTPLGRAKKMVQQMEYGHDENDIALLFWLQRKNGSGNRGSTWMLRRPSRRRLRLERVTVTQARQLVDMPPEKQRETVKQLEAAAEGVTGHEKARRQRAVLGDTKPRLKSRKEITLQLKTACGEYAAALLWVLGDENTPV